MSSAIVKHIFIYYSSYDIANENVEQHKLVRTFKNNINKNFSKK